ncbi:MAG: GNAT family N-acetyltransferase [Candidatus Cloacimonadaceae bacterium]|nr:GNAT family N-acetyltransferase [Candidatus Cloacimonadaceae bacterium]MDP3113854.1 GNAT family N-acetyltransferase [Candidatus Cloacimonadaceae bacterium]
MNNFKLKADTVFVPAINGECVIRLAEPGDRKDLISISRTIWEGHDYLPQIMDKWISEPYFIVCEFRGRVIACLKLSLLPDNVLWFEGLRVHGRFQGKGIATLMNRFAMGIAVELKKLNPPLSFEFCTYYKNAESLHLTQKVGFEVVQNCYQLDKRGVRDTKKPKILKDYDMSIFSALGDFIPLGWQALHNAPASLAFIRKHAVVFQTPQSIYLLGGVIDKHITFLTPPPADLKPELAFYQHFHGSRRKYGIVLSPRFVSSLPLLSKHGFNFWDEEKEPVANMYVLKMAEDRISALDQ